MVEASREESEAGSDFFEMGEEDDEDENRVEDVINRTTRPGKIHHLNFENLASGLKEDVSSKHWLSNLMADFIIMPGTGGGRWRLEVPRECRVISWTRARER